MWTRKTHGFKKVTECLIHDETYLLGKFWMCKVEGFRERRMFFFENDARGYYNIIKSYWRLVNPYFGAMLKIGFKEMCCAQFVVSVKE